MDKNMVKEYTLRVTQANKTELVVIIYELIMQELKDAKASYLSDNLEEGKKHMKKAQAYLQELKGSLNFQYEISQNLLQLYRYVYDQCVKTILRQEPIQLDSAMDVISRLHDSFAEVAKQDTSGPVMQNTQQVYAGLTYTKGSLNEVFMNPDEANRGFRA